MRNEKGQFAPGNSFAKGHGAPKGNQNAKGQGAPARNTNAVKTGRYMRFEEGETPYDRLRGGESEHRWRGVSFGYRYIRVRRKLAEVKEGWKKARR